MNRRKFFAACASVTTVALMPALPKPKYGLVAGEFYQFSESYVRGPIPWSENPIHVLYRYQKEAWRHIALAFDFAEVEMRTMAALLDEDV